MKTIHKVLVGGGVALVLGGIVAVSLLGKEKQPGEEVYMAKASRKSLVAAVSGNGSIEPRTKVEVQSSVIGEIVELPVKEGQAVKKGDLLVQIDPDRYKAEVDRLEANLRMSRIAIDQQQISLENARRTLKRQADLHQKGYTAPEVLDRAQLDVDLGQINLESLREQVRQADAALDKARDELRKTTIRTPIQGVVTKLNAELGEMTMTGTMNNPGTVIMVVSDMGEILAEVDVDETRVVKVAPGQSARVVVDAVGELHPYTGKVTEIASTAVKRPGQEVQVFLVKVALDSPDARLRPGMTAKARIETDRSDDAVTVPIQSVHLKPKAEVEKILAARTKGKGEEKKELPGADSPKEGAPRSQDEKEIVYKVVSGKAQLTVVRTGTSDETDIVIFEGVEDGDTVVTGPYRAVKELKDGDAVKEKKAKAPEKKDKDEEGESKGAVQVKEE